MIDNPNLKLKYAGSVKNVFAAENDANTLWFSFTNQYSVFDWGKMPDLINNKGNALALIGTYIFQKLSNPEFWQNLPQSIHLKKFDSIYLQKRFTHQVFSSHNGLKTKGLPSHFLSLYKCSHQSDTWQSRQNLELLCTTNNNTNNKNSLKNFNSTDDLLMRVLAAEVDWPELKTIMGENLYFYPPINQSAARRLIPLEVVFSFGLLEGSSLKRKLDDNPQYAAALELPSVPKVNQWFARPVLQFFSKLESKDRLLTWQEATTIANLPAQQFEQLIELAIDTALALHVLFASHNLELWDGKLEFVLDCQSGQLLLADSVGPDEVRLLYNGIHLSKEILRQYYRPTAWYKSLATARTIAAKNGQEDWQQICLEELKQSPQPLPTDLKTLVNQLYGMLTNELLGQPVFPSHPNLKDFTAQLEKTLSKYKKEHVNA
jgi:phosphoribosylaminoimidazole-succinocarboxamide synthase